MFVSGPKTEDVTFQIIAKYGHNAYKVDISEEYRVSNTLNKGELAPYHGESELRTILVEKGGIEPSELTSGHGSTTLNNE